MADVEKITETVTIPIQEYKDLLAKAALLETLAKYEGYDSSNFVYTIQAFFKEKQKTEAEKNE